jgi:hypothetical protein
MSSCPPPRWRTLTRSSPQVRLYRHSSAVPLVPLRFHLLSSSSFASVVSYTAGSALKQQAAARPPRDNRRTQHVCVSSSPSVDTHSPQVHLYRHTPAVPLRLRFHLLSTFASFVLNTAGSVLNRQLHAQEAIHVSNMSPWPPPPRWTLNHRRKCTICANTPLLFLCAYAFACPPLLHRLC